MVAFDSQPLVAHLTLMCMPQPSRPGTRAGLPSYPTDATPPVCMAVPKSNLQSVWLPAQVMAIKSRHSGKLRDFKAEGAQYVEG